MTLYELAWACDLYRNEPDYAKYNKSYMEFVKATNGSPDLGDAWHRSALLLWLRKWGCRQFAVEYEELASDHILDWWEKYQRILFSNNKFLWELGGHELESASAAYRGLLIQTASFRKGNGEAIPVSIGPTGASKILFAIRPNALAPWDKAIRKSLGCSEFIITVFSQGAEKALEKTLQKLQGQYVEYVGRLKANLDEIAPSCLKCGFQLADLPKQLRRDHSSVPKLVDDFHWITMTQGRLPPDRETLGHWIKQTFPHWTCV